jgi:hypothetical protein
MAAMMRQRGMVLLPVTLALAVVGTLAWMMTRDGAITAATVDTQYDIDTARYLAEAGVNLLKWRNEQLGCSNTQGFASAITALDGGIIRSTGVSYKKPRLEMTVTATTPRGAVNKITLDGPQGIPLHDIAKKVEVTLSAQNGGDAFIRKNPALIMTNTYLETTDGNAHGLVKFGMPSIAPDIMVVEATVRLYLGSVQSTQAGSLGLHRLLRAWSWSSGWTSGWTNPGGDFAPQATSTIPDVLTTSKWYTARIDSLVQTWVAQPPTNLGMLLKPNGLVTARFNSFEASANPPQLFLRYYPLCK